VSESIPQAVWQTCRWNSSFTYTIPGLTAGTTYTVALDWAELTWKAVGQRIFNVAINGTTVLNNFDVYATAGYKTALQKQFSIAANSSGQIVIAFTQGTADNPFVSGHRDLAAVRRNADAHSHTDEYADAHSYTDEYAHSDAQSYTNSGNAGDGD